MIITAGVTHTAGTPHRYRRVHSLGCWISGVSVAGRSCLTVDGTTVACAAPALSCYRPGAVYTTASAPPEHCVESIWIVFRPWPALASLLDLPEILPGVGRLSLADHPHREAIVAAYRSLLHWMRTPGPLSDRLAENALERAWLLAIEAHRRRDPLPDERLRSALEHIDAHFDEPLTVEALARAASLSPSRFAHRFRAAMGVSPMAYVEALRMEEAKSLLLATNLPVKAVARRLGFDNPFHFSTRFRRCTGCSPTAFREAPDAAINRGVSPRHRRRSPSDRGTA